MATTALNDPRRSNASKSAAAARPLSSQPPRAVVVPRVAGETPEPEPIESIGSIGSMDSMESIESLAHDARNMLAALGLYCELLAEPGVLSPDYQHYSRHLNVVVQSGLSVIGRMLSITTARPGCELSAEAIAAKAPDKRPQPGLATLPDAAAFRARPRARQRFLTDLRAEIERRRGMLGVMLGARVSFEMECLPCPGMVRLTREDLGRILVNLVRNASEAIKPGGRVRITLQGGKGSSFLPDSFGGEFEERVSADQNREATTVLLCVQDDGPGIAPEYLNRIFQAGFTTKREASRPFVEGALPGARFGPPPASRGLGLGIVRGLVEAAGGEIRVVSRPGAGTRFEMEFPISTQPWPSSQENQQEGTRVQC